MKDDLRDRLTNSLNSELRAKRRPNRDLIAVTKRGRLLRRKAMITRAALAALVVSALGFLVLKGPPQGGIPTSPQIAPAATETQISDLMAEAAVSAIRAIARADYLDTTGNALDYQGVQEFEGGWLVTFDEFDCHQAIEVGNCVKLTSGGVQLRVELQDGMFAMTDVSGLSDEAARLQILNYKEEMSDEAPHFEFPDAEIVRFESSTGVQGSYIWVGPVPPPDENFSARCQAEVRDAAGSLVYKGQIGPGGDYLELTPPTIEELRSGSVVGIEVPYDVREIESGEAEIVCTY
jgi:hypothetical protein